MAGSQKNDRIKISDVAKFADVSPSTVSRVLNNPETVREKTLARVNEAINKLNYKPNILARSMRTGKSSMIAVVLPDITNLFFPELISGIEEETQKNKYRLLICNSNEDVGKEMNIIKDLSRRNIDGIILSSVTGNEKNENIEYLNDLSRNIPLVLVDRIIEDLEVSLVNVDNFKAMYQATKYFIENGHREIAFIGGPTYRIICKRRLEGYRQAFRDYNVPLKEELIFETNFKTSGGIKVTEKLIKNKLPSAIISSNDMMAIGALRVLISEGIKVPEDIEIIGFDDNPMASLTVPSLSTVGQPIKEMGLDATRLLFREINDHNRSPRTVLLDTELILRETTR